MEPCVFGEEKGAYDDLDELSFGLMFHGFDYPDETGENLFQARFWHPVMRKGVIEFPAPEACSICKFIRPMTAKTFVPGKSHSGSDEEELARLLEVSAAAAYPDARVLLEGESI